MSEYRFEHDRALACRDWLLQKSIELVLDGFDSDETSPNFSSRLYIYERILPYEFDFYPDYTCPWHLLQHEHCRWDHVYQLIKLIEHLRQPTGGNAGEPIVLEPFQVMILFAFFGPEDPDTGLRIVREGILTLGRKQAKTSLVSAMATALLSIDPSCHGFAGQEIQVGASDREQAGIMFMMAERYTTMDRDLGLSERFRSVPSRKTLTHKKTLSAMRCLSSDAHRHLGGNPVMVLLDECGGIPNNLMEEFYSVLTTGFGAQKEPLTLLLSTQAPNDQHMFSQMVDKAMRLNTQEILPDPEFAGFVYTVPEMDMDGVEIDPFDEKCWRLAAPGWGTIYNPDDMRSWARRATDMPSLQNKYENLKLNRRVSETSAFMSRTVWERNTGPGFDADMLLDRRCTLGLDLSETTDLTSLVALFDPIPELDGRCAILPYFWIPGEGLLERARRDKVPYDVWAKKGLIDVSSPKVVNYALVAQQIVQCMSDFQVVALGFDRWKMKWLSKELEALGISFYDDDERKRFLVEVGQGYKDQSVTVQLLEESAINEELAHNGHPILTWNVSNAVVVRDPARNRKFDKARSFGRIDGCVALGLARHVREHLASDPIRNSIYNDTEREILM